MLITVNKKGGIQMSVGGYVIVVLIVCLVIAAINSGRKNKQQKNDET